MNATAGVRRVTLVVFCALTVAAAACTPGQSTALNNTAWTLVTIGGAAVSAPVEPTLVFGTGGSFMGIAGCNDFFGEATIGEGTIKVERIGATAIGCPDPATEQLETAYLKALQMATRWTVVGGGTLTLTGSSELTFSRSLTSPPPSARPSL